MSALQLIERKRDGGRLSGADWRRFIGAYVADELPDYQMAAMLMAVYLNGMDDGETAALLDAMLATGATLPRARGDRVRIDKHSTGGVGDKVSLVLAPLVAACGVAVPMISGRALGHTGGTLDKLAAIPGFRSDLPLDQARAQLDRLGCILIGQTAEIAPADRRMYALRDATATVESIPLVAASIMSKKLTEGLSGLALDVTRGPGAFFPDLERGLALAGTIVALGAAHDCPVVALVTAMDRPLGRACGNALEVEEAIHALTGDGPPDLMAVTYALGAEMLVLAGVAASPAEAWPVLEAAIASGDAARRFQAVIEAQGGNPGIVDDPAVLPQAGAQGVYRAPHAGVVMHVAPRTIGRGIAALGGGRSRVDDRIDPAVGFSIGAVPGARVAAGAPLATVHARDTAGVAIGLAVLAEAIPIGEEASAPLPLISHRVTRDGVAPYNAPRASGGRGAAWHAD
jgi:pyrimidine-nucleoside phosphorylase